jgi:hypothetical protein
MKINKKMLMLFFFFICSQSIMIAEENKYIEIYHEYYFIICAYNRTPEELLNRNKYSKSKIKICNPRYFEKVYGEFYKRRKQIDEDTNIVVDYKLVAIIYNGDKKDTISFNKVFGYIMINSIKYEFDWGLFYIILLKLPKYERESIEKLIFYQLYW